MCFIGLFDVAAARNILFCLGAGFCFGDGFCWLLFASASAGCLLLRPLLVGRLLRPLLVCLPHRPLLEQDNASLTVCVITQSPLGELFLPDRAPFAPTDLG
jgi:hypothetical protein